MLFIYLTHYQRTLGRGIYRRYFRHVGLKEVNRCIATVKNLVGSKRYHQFMDIGVEGWCAFCRYIPFARYLCMRIFLHIYYVGKLLIRHRPCHFCPRCVTCSKDDMRKKCANMEMCGKPEIVTLEVVSGSPNLPVTRNGLMLGGIGIVESCRNGDFLIIELTGTKDAWMIGEVTKDGSQFISKFYTCVFVRVRVFFCFYFEGFGRHIEEEDGVFDSYMDG